MINIALYTGRHLYDPNRKEATAEDIRKLWAADAGCDPADILLPGIHQEHILVLAATINGSLVGLARFVTSETKTKRYATLHDAFVDPSARSQGIGKMLTQTAIDLAKEKHLAYLELTSRPKREAANHIYQSLGFTLLAKANGDEGTNYYRYFVQ